MKIVVVYGGDGCERDVSIRSGREVGEALREGGHSVILWEVPSMSELIKNLHNYEADIFFIALHGDWGEDGRIQAVLEGADIPFSGSPCSACSMAMDKWRSKILFQAYNVPVPPAILLRKREGIPDLSGLGFDGEAKIVVKPNSCGSTIGISIIDANDEKSFRNALSKAFYYDDSVLVEKYIPGRELTVTVVGDGLENTSLPVVEIIPMGGFYSYEAKYTSGKSRYNAPADLSPDILRVVENASIAAFSALGCSVYARVDIRLDVNGNPFILEVNTVPGMTGTSLVPKAAKAAGYSFSSFLDHIIDLSLKDRSDTGKII